MNRSGCADKRNGAVVRLPWGYFQAALTGLVVGYCLAILLGRSVWLEMRVNVGHVLPLSTVFFLLVFGSRSRPMRLSWFLFFEGLAAVLLFSTYGLSWSTIIIVPAGLFRDGFHLRFLSLAKIDLFLLCFLGAAKAFWIHSAIIKRRRGGSHCRRSNRATMGNVQKSCERSNYGKDYEKKGLG
jgi:hypothetical protein